MRFRDSLMARLGGSFSLCLAIGIGLTLTVSVLVSNRQGDDQLAAVSRFVNSERDTQRDLMNQALARKARSVAELLAPIAAQPIADFDYERLQQLMRTVLQDPDVGFARILDPEGKQIAGSGTVSALDVVSVDIVDQGSTVGVLDIGVRDDRTVEAVTAMEARLSTFLQAMDDSTNRAHMLMTVQSLVFGLAVLLLGLLVNVLIVRGVTRPLHAAIEWFDRIGSGDYSSDHSVARRDEIGSLFDSLRTMQSKLAHAIDSARDSARVGRIKTALDNVSSPVMVVGADRVIVYVNEAATRLFTTYQSALQAGGLVHLDASRLEGASVSTLFEDSSGTHRDLDRLEDETVTELEFSGCTLRFTASPVFDEQGSRLGTALEWLDRTSEVHAEHEVQALVDAAAQGNFSQRVDCTAMRGFYLQLGQLLNSLMSTAEQALHDVGYVIQAVAGGDLTQQVRGDFEGQFAQLKEDVNATSQKLREVVGHISTSAANVRQGVGEISQGNASLSTRTRQQAASVEEAASAMMQMTTTVKQNAEHALNASQLTQHARSEAERGSQVAGNAVGAVGAIRDASKRIAEITGVIDEIAFQTNLLALNAAVEAARAGDQGRGFAVVAAEVRNLAGRSATAAKEIKALIEDTVAKVDEGAQLVEQSGQSLASIVQSVQEVNKVVSMISHASEEQTEGIGQISASVARIEEMTQHNSELVDQVAEASRVVGNQAQQLDELVGYFDLDGDGHAEAAAAAPTAERRRANRPWSSGADWEQAPERTAGDDGSDGAAPAGCATQELAAS